MNFILFLQSQCFVSGPFGVYLAICTFTDYFLFVQVFDVKP